MLFTSVIFILFFAMVFLIYYTIPGKAQWIWLLIASCIFYAYAGPVYLIYLASISFLTWICARLIGNINKIQEEFFKENRLTREEKKHYKKQCNIKKKYFASLSIVISIGLLAYLKYFNFFAGTVISMFFQRSTYTYLNILLPVGLSFYTFICIGYCIDVYREICEAEKNYFRFLLFTSFFPHVLQGPIDRFAPLSEQLFKPHKFNYDSARSGLLRIAWGFAEKLIIANGISKIISGRISEYCGPALALCYILYAFQIYADFKGYMDIALGAAESMGIALEENFNMPYFSKSIAEFWRRWHITLGAWFRDYLFYPLLRTKALSHMAKKWSKTSVVISLIIVWFATGLWHGANWNYVLWGLYYGVFIISAILLQPVYIKVREVLQIEAENKYYKLLQILRTFLLVCFGYILFKANGAADAFNTIERLFVVNPKNWNSLFQLLNIILYSAATPILIIMFMMSLLKYRGIAIRKRIFAYRTSVRWLIYLGLITIIIIFGTNGTSESEFIYFKF